MSKTSMKERLKAVRLAWEREQQLVQEGKGTRDWTEEQQKDILDPDKGKAYDDSGRAFEGQHMKSAVEYPEYQGDPDNIQFLTREEHLEAHKGSWQNPTNWYYNPETKEFIEFGDNKPIPCEPISLSQPIRKIKIDAQEQGSGQEGLYPSQSEEPSENSQLPLQDNLPHYFKNTPHEQTAPTLTPEVHESLGEKILRAVDAAREFDKRHPKISNIVKWGVALIVSLGTASAVNRGSDGRGSENDESVLFDSFSSSSDDDIYGDPLSSKDYPDERSSPREHDVSGYDRQQNGKTVHVKPYKRGVKHDDD